MEKQEETSQAESTPVSQQKATIVAAIIGAAATVIVAVATSLVTIWVTLRETADRQVQNAIEVHSESIADLAAELSQQATGAAELNARLAEVRRQITEAEQNARIEYAQVQVSIRTEAADHAEGIYNVVGLPDGKSYVLDPSKSRVAAVPVPRARKVLSAWWTPEVPLKAQDNINIMYVKPGQADVSVSAHLVNATNPYRMTIVLHALYRPELTDTQPSE